MNDSKELKRGGGYRQGGACASGAQGDHRHMDCDDCTEDYVFLLRQGGREFGMGLTTVLSMLAFAEHEGAVPPLSTEWWIKVSRRYQ